MECPRCHHKQVHRSRHRGWIEWVRTRITNTRYLRCDECNHRFLAAKNATQKEKAKPNSGPGSSDQKAS